jgi:hypothetical protein
MISSRSRTLFYLLFGNMPWREYSWHEPTRREPTKHAMIQVAAAKQDFNDALPIYGLPVAFNDFLRLARTSDSDSALSLTSTCHTLNIIATKLGARKGAPLDWTPISIPPLAPRGSKIDPKFAVDYDEDLMGNEDTDEDYSSIYLEEDICGWVNIRFERDKALTLPDHDAETLDEQIPDLGRILDDLAPSY